MIHDVIVFVGGAVAASVLWAWWAISGGLRELHAGMREGFEEQEAERRATKPQRDTEKQDP